jgi:thymidylate synthase (FAD)
MVEAPGTAPGSTTIIPNTVYRHSRQASKSHIRRTTPEEKRHGVSLSEDQTIAIPTAPEMAYKTLRATVPALEARLHQAVPLLDHGFVRVIDYMGDDNAIVQAARVSYGRGTRKVSEDTGLIRYLMRHRHTTPFEMCEIKFHVKLPIFIARQWIRHRMASVNEYSARYSVMDREFYIPDPSQLAAQSTLNRQGREAVLEGDEAARVLALLRADAERCYDHYTWLLNEDSEEKPADPDRQGLARELARMNLTLNTYTQWYWKTDLHNLFQFLSLRADSHAQYEIRVYAEAMLEMVEAWVPVASQAFRDYRMGAHSFSAPMMAVLRRMLAGETVEQPESGLSTREWREMMATLQPA